MSKPEYWQRPERGAIETFAEDLEFRRNMVTQVAKEFRALPFAPHELYTPESVASFFQKPAAEISSDNLRLCLLDNCNQRLPADAIIDYRFIAERSALRILNITAAELSKVNQLLRSGSEVFGFCCPDYSREAIEGGWVYTFKSLGSGIGLTAERLLPLVAEVIKTNPTQKESSPMIFNIGVADFESNNDNSALSNIRSQAEFLQKIERQTAAIASWLFSDLSNRFDCIPKPEGELLIVEVREEDNLIAKVKIAGITKLFPQANFSDVSQFRDQELAAIDQLNTDWINPPDRDFTRRITKLLKQKAFLLLKWLSPEERAQAPNLKEDLTPQDLAALLEKPENVEFQVLLTKLFRTVASYRVIADALNQTGGAVQLTGDSLITWQTMAPTENNPNLARISVKPCYAGA